MKNNPIFPKEAVWDGHVLTVRIEQQVKGSPMTRLLTYQVNDLEKAIELAYRALGRSKEASQMTHANYSLVTLSMLDTDSAIADAVRCFLDEYKGSVSLKQYNTLKAILLDLCDNVGEKPLNWLASSVGQEWLIGYEPQVKKQQDPRTGRFHAKPDKPKSAATKATYIRNLNKFLNWAVEHRLLPYGTIKQKPKVELQPSWFEPDEVLAISQTLAGQKTALTSMLADLVLVAFYTGLPQAEVTQLRCGHVDFDSSMIKIGFKDFEGDQLLSDSGRPHSLKLLEEVVPTLKRLCNTLEAIDPLFRIAPNGEPFDPEFHLCTTSHMQKVFKRTLIEAVPEKSALSFKHLRFGCGAFLLKHKRWSPAEVSHHLGHRSLDTTHKQYNELITQIYSSSHGYSRL